MDGKLFRDLFERVANTFWQGAVAAAPVTFVPDLGWLEQTGWVMGAGGIAAVLALVKGMAATYRGRRDSASLSSGV